MAESGGRWGKRGGEGYLELLYFQFKSRKTKGHLIQIISSSKLSINKKYISLRSSLVFFIGYFSHTGEKMSMMGDGSFL